MFGTNGLFLLSHAWKKEFSDNYGEQTHVPGIRSGIQRVHVHPIPAGTKCSVNPAVLFRDAIKIAMPLEKIEKPDTAASMQARTNIDGRGY